MFLIIGMFLLIFFGIGSKRTDVVLTDFHVAEDGKSIHLKVAVASSAGYTKYMHVKQGGDNKYITFYSTFGINNKFGAKNEFDIEVNNLTGDIYFYNGDGGYIKVLEKDKITNNWKIPSSESKAKKIIARWL